MTPTNRSLELLRDAGWHAVEVEVRLGALTRDLLGMFDLLAFRNGETLAVQVTTASNQAARIRKITNSPNLPAVRAAGWTVMVHGWRQRKGVWVCNQTDLS